jgi:ChaB
MPRSSRYGRTDGVPRTIRRSSPEAQATFTEAHENAVEAYGAGDQADRAAFAALKEDFEKRGDMWIAKDEDGTSD